MLITAVISTRDRQNSLPGCVANFIANGIHQIIIVDQSHYPISHPFPKSKVMYCHRPDITSASAARNFGGSIAKSPWLWFADDDCWLNHPFPHMKKVKEKIGDAGIVFFPWRRKNRHILLFIKTFYWLSKKNRFYGWLYPLTGTPFFVVKKFFFDSILFDNKIGPGNIPTPYSTSEDLDFAVRVIKKYPHFALVDDNVVDHRLNIYDTEKWQNSIRSRLHVMERQGIKHLYFWKGVWYVARYFHILQVRYKK